MPKAYASTVIDAPIDKVWAYVRDFHRGGEYQSTLVECKPDGDRKGDQLGSRRIAVNNHGQRSVEELVALSDIDYSGSYRLVEVDAPISNYLGSFRLVRITDTNQTFIEWSSEFDFTGDGDPAQIVEFIEREVYGTCFEGLKALVIEDLPVSHSA